MWIGSLFEKKTKTTPDQTPNQKQLMTIVILQLTQFRCQVQLMEIGGIRGSGLIKNYDFQSCHSQHEKELLYLI